MKKYNKAQSFLEYSILLIIIIAAFLTMQNYVKRGIQGRWKDSVDGLGGQYDPKLTTGTKTQRMSSNSSTEMYLEEHHDGYETMRTDRSGSEQTVTGRLTTGH